MQRACEPRRLGAFCKILSFNLRRWSTVFCFRVEGLGLRVRRWNTIVPFCCRISFLCCRQHSLRATATVRRCSCIYCNQVFQADFHLQFFSVDGRSLKPSSNAVRSTEAQTRHSEPPSVPFKRNQVQHPETPFQLFKYLV